MSDQDLDKYRGAGITRQEKDEILRLKQQELNLKQREIIAIENRNNNIRNLIFSMIGVLIVLIGGLFFVLRTVSNSNMNANTEDDSNRELLAIQSTNDALAFQLTAVKLNESSGNSQLQPTNSLQASTATSPAFNQIPTPTSYPTSTPITDTPPGSVLDVGQAWKQSGFELMLTEVEMGTASNSRLDPVEWGLFISFDLSNFSGNDVPVRYNLAEAITAVDNFGNNLKIGSVNQDFTELIPETVSEVFRNGSTIKLLSLPVHGDSLFSVFFYIDVTSERNTEVIVNVNISRVSNARWRIPIYH